MQIAQYLVETVGEKFVYASHYPKQLEEVVEEECIHWEHDHGVCMDCGEDRTEHFIAAAESAYEGDR